MDTNPVVHFEMPAQDMKRMTAFYEKAFGWKTQMMGEEYGVYAWMQTTGTKDGRPTEPGAINGGFFPKSKDSAQHPSVVIAVDDIRAAMKKVRNAGEKILSEEPTDIPKIGLYVSFIDTEGNRVSMLQPQGM